MPNNVITNIYKKNIFTLPISNFKCFTTHGYNVTRNVEIKLTLTLFNNIYVVSFKKFHEEAVDHKIKRTDDGLRGHHTIQSIQ